MGSELSEARSLAALTVRAFCVRVFCPLLAIVLIGPSVAFADRALDDYKLAVGLYKQKRWALASDSFQKFIKEHPRNAKVPIAQLYRGLALFYLEKYHDARKILRGFVKDYPQNRNVADAMYWVGKCSHFLDDLKSAEMDFKAFVKKYPKHDLLEWALPFLADTQLRLKKPLAAVLNFQKSLEKHPKGLMAEDSKFGLAKAFEALNQTSKAIKIYKQLAADRTSARAPKAQRNLASIYFEAGQYLTAAAAYGELEKRFPRSSLVSTARFNGGYAFFQAGDYRKAIALFNLAAKDKQQSSSANYWKGVSHKHLGEYTQAAQVLKTTYEADSTGPLAEMTLYQRAVCVQQSGRYDAARALFLDVVAGWPKGEFGDDSLHIAGDAALSAGRLDEVEKLIERFRNEYPNSDLQMRNELLQGRLLNARGGAKNDRAAVVQFQKVISESRITHTKLLARFHLARTLQNMGEHQRVLETIGPIVDQVKKHPGTSEFVDALIMQGTCLQAQADAGFQTSLNDKKKHQAALNLYRAAAEAMNLYLKLSPDSKQAGQALATRAVAEARAGSKQQAQSDINTLAEKFPDSPLVGQTTYRVAEIAYESKQWAWASLVFTSLVKMGVDSSYHSAGLSGAAWSQYQQKRYLKAAEGFAQVVKHHPDDEDSAPEAAYMQGKALANANRLVEAATAYSSAFKKYAPAEPKAGSEGKGAGKHAFHAGLQAARTLRTLKKIEESDAAYAELIDRFPKLENLDKRLDEWALLNYEAGNYERSDEIFRRLIQETPQSDLADNARLSLAESDFIADRLNSARAAFLELKASSKSDAEVQEVSLNHLVSIAVEQRKWKEVKAFAQEFLTRFPKSKHRRDAEFHLVNAQLTLNDLGEAKQTLLKLKAAKDDSAVNKAGWFPRVWILLAEIAFQQKKYADVAQTVDEFRTLLPNSRFLYQADEILGRSYKSQAKFVQARTAFQRVIDDKSGRRTETAARSQLFIAETYLFQKNYKAAQLEYLKVYNLYKFPQLRAPALYQAAQCDEVLKQWRNAVNAYEALLKEFPESEYAPKAKARLPIAKKRATS